jgi:hypothetical protein
MPDQRFGGAGASGCAEAKTNPLWERTVCKFDRPNGDPLGGSLQQHWEMSQRPFEAFVVEDGMPGAKLETIDSILRVIRG